MIKNEDLNNSNNQQEYEKNNKKDNPGEQNECKNNNISSCLHLSCENFEVLLGTVPIPIF